MRALVAGNGLQITFGFLVFWMLQGWAVLGETLAPDNPDARSPGRLSFVAGQGIALFGLVSLALLCAHALKSVVSRHEMEFLPLGVAAVLYLLESIWIAYGHPLPRERRPIEQLAFGSGRDLVLRHGSTLFLGQGLLATVQGSHAVAFQASGVCLGWGASVLVWDLRIPSSFQRTLRYAVSPLTFLTGLLLLTRAWRSF
jgi:hypothetical protein